MSYDEEEKISEAGFRMDDDTEEEPLDMPEGGDEFKFDEEEEDDPEDRYH